MCGIVGAVAQRDVAPILLEGLRRLEYRGYDSAGIAILNHNRIERVRKLGKVKILSDAVDEHPVKGGLGIAHTRWATHGEPSEINAHPHVSGGDIAVVHNGIIENHEYLKKELQGKGYEFISETDTEVIVHLVAEEYKQTNNLLKAVQSAVKQLEGAYGAVFIHRDNTEEMIVARSGSPLVVGKGIGEMFVASDQLALLPVTRQFMFLEEGEVAHISRESLSIYTMDGAPVERAFEETSIIHDAGDKGPYRHHMLKEIFEQPDAIVNTLEGRVVHGQIKDEIFGVNAKQIFEELEAIHIVACGTSFHAAMVAKYWLEAYANISCHVEIASEYRYRKSFVPKNALFITISQSGETADTLAALRLAKKQGFKASLSICNVPGSSLVRESDLAFMTRAGVEIGVASTKAFTTQLTGLLMLTVCIAKHNGLQEEEEKVLVQALESLPGEINQALEQDSIIEKLAEDFSEKHHSLFLGRGEQYPIAMEGALKLKEISYIHAEAYAAGELKHGPLALIDHEMPIIVIAPNNELLEKLKSNVEEVRARGGQIYVFADENVSFAETNNMHLITINACHNITAPIIFTIPLQLLSYHVAVSKGTDVDQPRNLAKSVTVE